MFCQQTEVDSVASDGMFDLCYMSMVGTQIHWVNVLMHSNISAVIDTEH